MKHFLGTLLFLGILLFGCIKEGKEEYYKANLVRVIRMNDGAIDTVKTDLKDQYSLISFITPHGELSQEFQKNNKSIFKMRTNLIYSIDSIFYDQRIRTHDFVYMDHEKTFSHLRIDTLINGNWELSHYYWDGYVLIRNFPFEGINCFKYED